MMTTPAGSSFWNWYWFSISVSLRKLPWCVDSYLAEEQIFLTLHDTASRLVILLVILQT